MNEAYFIRTVHMKSWFSFSAKKLTFEQGINFLVGAPGSGKSLVFEAIRFAIRGNDKKIDPVLASTSLLEKDLPNVEIAFQGMENNKILVMNRFVKKDKSIAHKFSGHLIHSKWFFQGLEEDAGHEVVRYLLGTTTLTSIRYLNYFAFNRAFIGLVYFLGKNKEIKNYTFLTQVIRELGRDITEKRRQQGVVIDNYRNSLRRLENLQSSLEPLKQKMRSLRKQLARLHRSSAAKTYLLMLQSRQVELQEKMLRLRNKYLILNDFEEGIEKRIEQLKTDVNVGKKELELLWQEQHEKRVKYLLLDETMKRLQDSIYNNKTMCPVCLEINVSEEHLMGEKRKVKDELNDIQFDLEAIDNKLLTAKGFLERSQAMLYEALRDKEKWEQILHESKTVQKTLKQLAMISTKSKESMNLKKVEDNLRVARNKYTQIIREIGRLEGKLGMSAEQGVQEITELEDMKVITKFLESTIKEALIESFQQELDGINLFLQKFERVLGGVIMIDKDLKIWFKKENEAYKAYETLSFSKQLLIQLLVKLVVVSHFLPLKTMIIDEVFTLLDTNEKNIFLKTISLVSNVQVIMLVHASDLLDLNLNEHDVTLVGVNLED